MKNVLKQENKYVSKELKSKNTKSKSMIIFERKYRYEFQKSILKEIVILRQIMMRHL